MRQSAIARKPKQQPSRAFDPEFARDVLSGLSQPKKSLPCRYFYDSRGSELFEEITRLEEYYPTRTEIGILQRRVAEIAELTQPATALVELGSGSSRKTEILLGGIASLKDYVAIDVCAEALIAASDRLADRFPHLELHTVVADFCHEMRLPEQLVDAPKLGFFPGSTIGNLVPTDAVRLLARLRRLLAPKGRLVIGVDLKKNIGRLVQAYDDDSGVTAAFNLNLLTRINRELGGDFDLSNFRHCALYNAQHGRIEIYIVSARAQSVRVLGRTFHFAAGESIHTEYSYKYTVTEFQALAGGGGWLPRAAWVDEEALFSVHLLAAAD